jgi:amino acid adenylation domain-containing protein
MTDSLKKKLGSLSSAQIRELMAKRKKSTSDKSFKVDRNPQNVYPVSKGQERFWFLSLLSEDPALYNIPIAVSLKQDQIDRGKFEEKLNGLIAKHAILRTSFFEKGGKVYQQIHPHLEVQIDYEVLDQGLSEAEQKKQAARIGIEHGRMPFDVSQLSLLRIKLVKAGTGQYFLLLNLHHLISDGWTNAMIAQALMQDGTTPNRHEDLHYIDYVNWEEKWLASPDHENQRQFWRRVLDDLPAPYQFPKDFQLSGMMEDGNTHSMDLPAGLHDRVVAFCQEKGATPFHFYMTCYVILLGKYADVDDLIVGTPVANREQRHFQYMYGLFINSLPMRFSLEKGISFSDLLAANADRITAYLEHQKIPIGTLMQSIDAPYSAHENPLYAVHFAYQYFPQTQGKDTFTPLTLDYGLAKFDLNFWVEIYGDTNKLSVTFRKNRFSPQKIKQFMQHYIRLVEYSISNSDHGVATSNFLPDQAGSVIGSKSLDLGAECWVDHYLQTVHHTPDNTALIDQQGRLTYQELDGMVCNLAGEIQRRGVAKGDIAILRLARGRNYIVGLLACLRLGVVYLPADENIVPEQFGYIVADSKAKLLISAQPHPDIETLDIDALAKSVPAKTMPRDPSITGQDIAYIIYTSGSTGNPKGVAITHRGLANHYVGMWDYIGVQPLGGFLHLSALDADLGNTMIYMALGSGAHIVMPDKDHVLDPVLLGDFLAQNPADVMKIAPSHLLSFADKIGQILPAKILICAGEQLPAHLARSISKLKPDLRLLNTYGPTEATITTSLHELGPDTNLSSIPIGKPITNTKVYVLNRDHQLRPKGCIGEIHITGASLAAEYLENSQLTDQKFIRLPELCAERLYATGDMGFVDMTGDLVFTGRKDRQVKINGFRVEPAEIEVILNRHKAVKSAAVWPHHTEQGARLRAAILPANGCDLSALKAYLARYFHPAIIPVLHNVKAMPTTMNGKTDFKKLAALVDQQPQPQPLAISQPRDITELRVWEIFQNILGTSEIPLDASFFDLGGHSLQAASLLMQVNQTLRQNIRVSALVQHPSVQGLSCYIRTLEKADAPLVALSGNDKSHRLLWVHPAGGNVMSYLTIAKLMADRYDTSAFVAAQNTALAPKSIEEFAKSYIAALPTKTDVDKPILAGWSMGVLIAHQMAVELQKQGQTPPLILIDQPALPRSQDADQSFDERILNYIGRIEIFTGKKLKNCLIVDAQTDDNQIDYSLLHTEFIRIGLAPPDVSLPAFKTFLDLLIFHNKIVADFTPQKYAGPALLVRASEQVFQTKDALPAPQDLGWGPYCSDLTIIEVPGNHMTMLNDTHGKATADAIDQWLKSLNGLF